MFSPCLTTILESEILFELAIGDNTSTLKGKQCAKGCRERELRFEMSTLTPVTTLL